MLTAQQRHIHRAARQGIPHLADFCLVHIATPRSIRCITAVHRTTDHARDMLELISSRPIPRDDLTSTVAGVVRSGKPALRRRIRQERIQGAHGGSVMRLYNRLAPRSALVVPLVSGPAVFGTLSLCYSHSGRSYSSHQVAEAQRLAERVAAALIAAVHATSGLLAATRHAGEGAAVRRRLDSRN